MLHNDDSVTKNVKTPSNFVTAKYRLLHVAPPGYHYIIISTLRNDSIRDWVIAGIMSLLTNTWTCAVSIVAYVNRGCSDTFRFEKSTATVCEYAL